MPENENFELEYVTDKAWAGYNWYKGNNFSLIQVNIDFPILIDRAIDLASHESKEETDIWMEKYALRRASESTFRFPETYRSYIINYNWGQDLVKEYIESRGGTKENPTKRWAFFTELISKPQVPENLR